METIECLNDGKQTTSERVRHLVCLNDQQNEMVKERLLYLYIRRYINKSNSTIKRRRYRHPYIIVTNLYAEQKSLDTLNLIYFRSPQRGMYVYWYKFKESRGLLLVASIVTDVK